VLSWDISVPAYIAMSHILALEKLESSGNRAYNLAGEVSYSVLEVLSIVRKAISISIPVMIGCGYREDQ